MRGRYRILLGMAAGVGKTYRMLQEGRQAQGDGRDVVIGYLEPHDRPETEALAEGLEVVPHLRTEHGGLELNEMDVDAVIRRAPELSLIDELAHTNAPGMRNEKRYQDIDEVLDAGIDVISTVNVQHLESLNDAIAELTACVRETAPTEAEGGRWCHRRGRRRCEASGKVCRDRAGGAVNLPLRPPPALRELAPAGWPRIEERRHAGSSSASARCRRAVLLSEPQRSAASAGRHCGGSAPRWMRFAGASRCPDEATQSCGAAAAAGILGAHLLEVEGDDSFDRKRSPRARVQHLSWHA